LAEDNILLSSKDYQETIVDGTVTEDKVKYYYCNIEGNTDSSNIYWGFRDANHKELISGGINIGTKKELVLRAETDANGVLKLKKITDSNWLIIRDLDYNGKHYDYGYVYRWTEQKSSGNTHRFRLNNGTYGKERDSLPAKSATNQAIPEKYRKTAIETITTGGTVTSITGSKLDITQGQLILSNGDRWIKINTNSQAINLLEASNGYCIPWEGERGV
jgi:hypothetical protein